MSSDMEVAAAGAAGGNAIIDVANQNANGNARYVRETRVVGAFGSIIKLTDINALKEAFDFKIFVKLVDTTGVCTFGPSNLKVLIDALQSSGIVYNCDQNFRSMCIKVNSAVDRTNLVNLIKSKLNKELHCCISVNGFGRLSNRFLILNLDKNLFTTRVNGVSVQNAYSRSIINELDNSMGNVTPHEEWFSIPFVFGDKAILMVHNQDVTNRLVEILL